MTRASLTASALSPSSAAAAAPGAWIFSRRVDLLAFALPAALSLALIAALPASGDESPEWVWISGVLLVDVAHVWSTAFVTYLSPAELRRHRRRYWLVPLLGWMSGAALYALGGAALFWRALAYVAVFHFVRQQYGWMALYRAREGDRTRAGALVDGAAVYAATLYPLVWWHVHLPRRFSWFVPGDFVGGLPAAAASIAAAAYACCLGAYVARALGRALRGRAVAWGKHLLLAGTAATWYAGIIACDDDAAFTLANVLSHGVPYAVLVFSYARHTAAREHGPGSAIVRGSSGAAWLRFLACLWLLAYLEELVWDRGVWHERSYLFGEGIDAGALEPWLVPLLALPQLTHYVLDGVFWRRAGNTNLRAWFSGAGGARPGQASEA